MLTTATPIFQHVPVAYADPVGLADQQAQGVVSLVVVRYEPGDGQQHDALGPFYDSYVAVSGQLLAVARTTADYRYPVTPAVALARFIEHRDAGRPAFVSVYELSEEDCARFVETVFFSECLKLHVDGADSAPLVAQQIVCCGCGGGILEVNDFSQPGEPRIRLLDLDVLAGSIGTDPPLAGSVATVPLPPLADGGARPRVAPAIAPSAIDPVGLASILAGPLDGVRGRVLLYDRAKNRAALPHRAGKPFDLDAAIEQANRLAEARRAVDPTQAAQQATVMASQLRAEAPPDQVEAVEHYLRDAAQNPGAVAPTHPHHVGLAAMVREMQGGGGVQPFAGLGVTASPISTEPVGLPLPCSPSGDGQSGLEPVSPDQDVAGPPLLPADVPLVAHTPPEPSTPDALPGGTPEETPSAAAPEIRTPASAPSLPASGGARHVLATELDVLRASVYALFEDAIGRDKAVAHEQHVLTETGIASPVSAVDTVAYLRALLCDDPPKRWHGYKRARGKIYGDVCTQLLTFHSANAHVDDVVIHEVGQLWARLCQ
ncbi:hypothetical protein [Rubricoccus marinus]|uniref:Uncharacterized protein n=1 Tax=Rubricoccus marinus TaxID=716817 RepID=A0A259TUG5_9BACT|nr:hypothetical protein [Rubricoccus marinus]OZC01383.1 hypothetical protein BSZ36_16985 [Rubricoccus marinus]